MAGRSVLRLKAQIYLSTAHSQAAVPSLIFSKRTTTGLRPFGLLLLSRGQILPARVANWFQVPRL